MNSDADSITDPVTIVGAGISGAACARVFQDAQVPFRIVDRGRAPGGRMSSPELHGRRVDLGAGYFTVRDQDFATLVSDWESRGLARQWANTFGILKPDTAPCTTTGPVRWATPHGLRSLVRDMLDGLDIEGSSELTDLPDGHVVVAMPDPQATRLTSVPDAVDYDPVIAVACGFEGLDIPFRDASFVNDHPDIDFVVDDGARRGDGASVLVVHTTSDRARRHLDDPDGAIAPVLDALRELSVVTTQPAWTHAHRWTFAKPAAQHDAAFALEQRDGRLVGFAGDQWCESGAPRIESAWRSGTNVAHALIDALRH